MLDDPALRAGLALLRANQARSAESIFEQAARTSDDARVWHYLGVARHLLGKLPAAADALRRSLAIDSSDPDVACALAAVLGQAAQWEEAERVLEQGLDAAPRHAGMHFNLAVALEHRGAHEEALGHYDAALASDAGHRQALLNRGALHLRDARPAQALVDFDALLRAEPRFVDGLLNRSRALLSLHRDDEALQAAESARTLAPHRSDARKIVALCLASLGRLAEATQVIGAADPGWDARVAFVGRGMERQHVCLWHDRDRMMQVIRVLLSEGKAAELADPGLLTRLLGTPLREDELCAVANAVARGVRAPSCATPIAWPAFRARLRVGFFSAGVGWNPEAFLLRRIVGDLDRRQFEVRLYALNRDDGTALRTDFASRADAYADYSKLDSAQIVDRARREELDIAIDCTGYLKPGRPEVFRARVAPVQAAYISSPCTAGPGIVDYRLSDALTTPPDAQPLWSEKLVLLPAPHWVHDNSLVPADAGSRADHLLPEDGFVFCCINQSWKIEPDAFSIWMRLMRAVDRSVLWLLDYGEANRNLRASASAHGIAPERLVFAKRVPLEQHLGRLGHASLFLDTFYFNAQTTSLDALWAGLPVLTREGATMASRLAATFVRSAGLPELVARTSEEYEATALRLATSAGELGRLRERLVAARSSAPVFDTPARVSAFGRGLLAMAERHRRGLAPDTLLID